MRRRNQNISKKGGFGSQCAKSVKSKDMFGQKFDMRYDNEEIALGSYGGFFCSVMILLIMASYTYQKVDVLKNKKDVDILQTTADSEYDPDYVFDYKKGFNVAAAFTAYDSNPEPILDDTIG